MPIKAFGINVQIPKGQYWECPVCHRVRVPAFKPPSQDASIADWTVKRVLQHIKSFHTKDVDAFIRTYPLQAAIFGVALKKDGSVDRRYKN